MKPIVFKYSKRPRSKATGSGQVKIEQTQALNKKAVTTHVKVKDLTYHGMPRIELAMCVPKDGKCSHHIKNSSRTTTNEMQPTWPRTCAISKP